MQYLRKQDIARISKILKKEGIHYSHLYEDLLDHICCDVEDEMKKGNTFKNAYEKVTKNIGNNGLKEVQDATIIYVNLNLLIMKKLMNYLAGIASVILACSLIFKLNHFRGANILMFAGFVLLFAGFFPLALIQFLREAKIKLLTPKFYVYLAGCIILIESGAALLFTHMHWPGREGLVVISWVLILLIFFPMVIFQIIKSDMPKTVPLALALFSYLFFAVTIVWGLNSKRNAVNLMTYTDANIMQETEYYKNKSEALLSKIQKDISDHQKIALLNSLDSTTDLTVSEIEENKVLLLNNNSIDINTLNKKIIRNMKYHYLHYEDVMELKEVLKAYQKCALEMAGKDKMLKMLIDDKLSVESVNIEKSGNITWEKLNFYALPGPIIQYNNLNRMERDVFLVYYQILLHLEKELHSDV